MLLLKQKSLFVKAVAVIYNCISLRLKNINQLLINSSDVLLHPAKYLNLKNQA